MIREVQGIRYAQLEDSMTGYFCSIDGININLQLDSTFLH